MLRSKLKWLFSLCCCAIWHTTIEFCGCSHRVCRSDEWVISRNLNQSCIIFFCLLVWSNETAEGECKRLSYNFGNVIYLILFMNPWQVSANLLWARIKSTIHKKKNDQQSNKVVGNVKLSSSACGNNRSYEGNRNSPLMNTR